MKKFIQNSLIVGLTGCLMVSLSNIETLKQYNENLKDDIVIQENLNEKLISENNVFKKKTEELQDIIKQKETEYKKLESLIYNKTHYNPYNLLEKSGANE